MHRNLCQARSRRGFYPAGPAPVERRSEEIPSRPVRNYRQLRSTWRSVPTLGPLSGSQRAQPGPYPGQRVRRSFRLTLAIGVRKACVQTRLKTARATEAGDSNPEDNLLLPRCDRQRPQRRGATSATDPRLNPHQRKALNNECILRDSAWHAPLVLQIHRCFDAAGRRPGRRRCYQRRSNGASRLGRAVVATGTGRPYPRRQPGSPAGRRPPRRVRRRHGGDRPAPDHRERTGLPGGRPPSAGGRAPNQGVHCLC